jgi:hypothetical protein
MSCFNPMAAAIPSVGNWAGRPKMLKAWDKAYRKSNITLPKSITSIPCKQCIGCRLDRSRQWAIRCMHEASLYEDNCFITLTYANEHLPKNKQLCERDMQLFFKRLRKRFKGIKIRYFYAGEYGDPKKTRRPHYHVILFNLDFADKKYWKTVKGFPYYKSKLLDEKIWKKGFCVLGGVTFESAAYTARYVTKKVNGKAAEQHYKAYNPYTGESYQLIPEYSRSSTSRGIGYDYYKKWFSDIYPSDEVVVRGHVCKPPEYYDRMLEQEHPEMYLQIKARRKLENDKKDDLLFRHLQAKELVTRQRMSRLVRMLEAEA